jgi:methyl-accepting chemotaxis protein
VESIGEVNGLSENTYGRAKQIVESVEELTKSAEYMNTNVQEIAEQMEEIGECVNEMSDSVGELHRHSENILQTNDGAKANLERIMDESRKSVEAVRDITAQIHETNNSIERVDEAVAMILSISAETNLLSLNASIEAARAGEQGKGFSVIAEEIFELSQQTAKGAEMIKQLAKTITNDSQKSVDLATQVQSMIVNEQDGLKDTFREYEKLSGDIGLSADEIRAIAQKTKELSEYKEKVIENVGNLGAVSEENTTSNEEVSGNISEIIAQVQNINADCSDMNDMAHQLEETMDFFS